MNIEIITKNIPDIPVVYIAKSLTMEEFDQIGGCFEAVGTHAIQNGGEMTASMMLYTGYENDMMSVECCANVTSLLPESGEIKSRIVPGGDIKAVYAVHKGSYSGLKKAWDDVMVWMEQQKCEGDVTKPMREVYLNNPMLVSEDELLTEIIVPLL